MEAMKEGSWLGTSAIRSQFRAKPSKRVDVDIPALIEPLDDYFADMDNFRVLWSRRWRNVGDHINLKECRVAISSLKRSCRVLDMLGSRKLTVSDNMVTVSALSKGRSSSFAMNRLCRVSAAYQLSCGVQWHLRHIETKRNVADDPSRNFELGHMNRMQPPEVIVPDTCSGHTSVPSQSSKQCFFGNELKGAVPRGRGNFFGVACRYRQFIEGRSVAWWCRFGASGDNEPSCVRFAKTSNAATHPEVDQKWHHRVCAPRHAMHHMVTSKAWGSGHIEESFQGSCWC